MRVGSSWGSGDCWPLILPFLATTAREQLQVSVAPSSPVRAALEKWLGASGVGRGAVGVWVEDEAAFKTRARGKYNVVVLPAVAVADEVSVPHSTYVLEALYMYVSYIRIYDILTIASTHESPSPPHTHKNTGRRVPPSCAVREHAYDAGACQVRGTR